MRNIPIITLLPRVWMLAAFTAASNYACLSNHPIIAAKWVQSYNEAWVRGADGAWVHNVEQVYTLQPAKTLFELCGAALYVPAIFSLIFLCVLTAMHLHFRETVDDYIHCGGFRDEFKAASPQTRLWIVMAALGLLFIGGCLVAGSVGK